MIIAAGLLIAFVLVIVCSNRGTRACRWREDRGDRRGALVHFRCAACGAEIYAPPRRPPDRCLKPAGAA